jgi:hypothetical protein
MCFWLKVVRVIERYRMHDGEADRSLSEGGDLRLLCLLLHVLIHILVWYHDSLRLANISGTNP